jgi:uncharacterized damage-inducible protein DinB
MRTTIEVIRELYAYDRWANGRMFDALMPLSAEEFVREVGGSFPSVRDTMGHLLAAEWLWLQRWKGTSPTALPDAVESPTPEALRAWWRGVEEEQAAFINGLRQEDLGRIVVYRTMAGEDRAQALGGLLHHVVNHSTYHRGQVVGQLRLLGRPAVATDYVLFDCTPEGARV